MLKNKNSHEAEAYKEGDYSHHYYKKTHRGGVKQ